MSPPTVWQSILCIVFTFDLKMFSHQRTGTKERKKKSGGINRYASMNLLTMPLYSFLAYKASFSKLPVNKSKTNPITVNQQFL